MPGEDEQEQELELEQDDEKVALILSRARDDQFSPYAYYMASIPSGTPSCRSPSPFLHSPGQN